MKKLLLIAMFGILAGCDVKEDPNIVKIRQLQSEINQLKSGVKDSGQVFQVQRGQFTTEVFVFVDPETKCQYLFVDSRAALVPRMAGRPGFTDRWQVCNN